MPNSTTFVLQVLAYVTNAAGLNKTAAGYLFTIVLKTYQVWHSRLTETIFLTSIISRIMAW